MNKSKGEFASAGSATKKGEAGMIAKITLNNIASYKHSTSLNTDKYVNLIYGLNGCGKSTLSNYLKNLQKGEYSECSIEGFDSNQEIIVYNTDFVQENFYESEQQKGIFTLSKENKDVEEKIAQAKESIKNEEERLQVAQEKKDEYEESKINKENAISNKVWEIKTKYSGGDRVLEYCLDGLKGNKTALLNHILNIQKPKQEPTETIENLKNKIQSISGENAKKYDLLNELSFNVNVENIEADKIFSKEIVGNENSTVSALITELKNSDWVKAGLKYVPDIKNENATCPFCQQKTITVQLVENIRSYFDKSYENDLNYLKNLLESYKTAINTLPNKDVYESSPKFESHKKDFDLQYSNLKNTLESNKRKIEDKINTPSVTVELENTSSILAKLNSVIQKINIEIQEHNSNIDQVDKVKESVKSQFWQIMRWKYDSNIVAYEEEKKKIKAEINKESVKITETTENINNQKNLIAQLQKQTVNIDEAVERINTALFDMGISDFKIEKDNENFYKIKREDDSNKVFISLSEGEKMIISFLYFIELCKGKKSSTEIDKKKIIVIDDPMSSLSNIYVYNIGRMIKNEFFFTIDTNGQIKADKNGNTIHPYEQVFVLTHSLYFFYELTDTKNERRKREQKLFRIQKNGTGSDIKEMKYEEIQNDYQAYWSIIKDETQPVALIANCMRNIVEYFFNFVEKTDLNNCFQKPELNSNRYQSLYRYINRESHSVGQNIYDFKELNYTDMKDAFRELFIVAGYEEHYNKMYGAEQ